MKFDRYQTGYLMFFRFYRPLVVLLETPRESDIFQSVKNIFEKLSLGQNTSVSENKNISIF